MFEVVARRDDHRSLSRQVAITQQLTDGAGVVEHVCKPDTNPFAIGIAVYCQQSVWVRLRPLLTFSQALRIVTQRLVMCKKQDLSSIHF